MGSRVEETIKRHDIGMNCAQAVACAYCDLFDMEEKEMFRVMEGFGSGMGGTYATCGAVTGAVAVAGLVSSNGDITNPVTKGATYQLSREITAKFKEKNGSLVCRELKGIDTGKVLRSCPDCIRDAAEILEEILKSKGIEF